MPEPSRFKVLCLHGYLQDADMFSSRIGSFRKALKSRLEFVFLDAPFLASPDARASLPSTTQPLESNDDRDADGNKAEARQGRSWWQWEDEGDNARPSKAYTYRGWDVTKEHLRAAILEHKPDGLMGFSQGAAAIGLLLSSLPREERPGFAIIVAGFLPRDVAYGRLVVDAAPADDTPCIIVYGTKDELVPIGRSKELIEALGGQKGDGKRRGWIEVFEHQGAHLVPTCSGDFKAKLATFLDKNPGFANCDPSASTSTYDGFDVDLIRYVASISNWTELVGYPPFNDNTTVYERHFYFVCVTYRVTPLIDILIGNDTMDRCAMGAGALTITARRWQQGVIFSYPFFRTGLGVVISAQPVQTVYNPWAFLLPFHWTIWLALAVTLFVVPMLVWLVENLVRTGSIPFHRESFEDIGFAIYTTLLTVFNLEVVSLLTIPAQAIIICFCFLNLVMVATYTANLAAKLTTSVQTVGFQAASDLQGTSVGAHGPYQQRLAVNHNLNTINTTWAGTSTFLDVFGQIQRKEISAYIFDYPILLYWKNFYDTDCQLTFLPEIEPFDYGIVFNRNFPRDIQGEFNVGILIAQGSAKLAQLEAKYVSVSSSCGATSMMGNENTLTFFQVSGLWIILGCAVGLALLFSVYRIVKVHCLGGVIEAVDYDHYEHHSPFRRGLSFRKHFHSESFTQHEISPQGASGPIRKGSKALWPGESQLIDPETTFVRVVSQAPSQGEIQKAPSGLPPLSFSSRCHQHQRSGWLWLGRHWGIELVTRVCSTTI